jgi:hypothetical protein
VKFTLTVAWFASLALLAAAIFAAEPAQQAVSPDLERKIRALIEQLGDDDFRVREQATLELIAIGPDALALLTEAHQTTSDFEIRARAERIFLHISPAAIQERLKRTVVPDLFDKDNNLKALLESLAEDSKRFDPERIGFKFALRGEPQPVGPARQFRLRQRPLDVALKLLAERYNMAYSIERDVIVFHPKPEGANQ